MCADAEAHPWLNNGSATDGPSQIRGDASSPSVYRMDHDPDKHEDQAIALALAAQHLVARACKPRPDSRRLAEALAQASAELWKPSAGSVGY